MRLLPLSIFFVAYSSDVMASTRKDKTRVRRDSRVSKKQERQSQKLLTGVRNSIGTLADELTQVRCRYVQNTWDAFTSILTNVMELLKGVQLDSESLQLALSHNGISNMLTDSFTIHLPNFPKFHKASHSEDATKALSDWEHHLLQSMWPQFIKKVVNADDMPQVRVTNDLHSRSVSSAMAMDSDGRRFITLSSKWHDEQHGKGRSIDFVYVAGAMDSALDEETVVSVRRDLKSIVKHATSDLAGRGIKVYKDADFIPGPSTSTSTHATANSDSSDNPLGLVLAILEGAIAEAQGALAKEGCEEVDISPSFDPSSYSQKLGAKRVSKSTSSKSNVRSHPTTSQSRFSSEPESEESSGDYQNNTDEDEDSPSVSYKDSIERRQTESD